TGLILTLACIATAANPPGDSTDDWPSYGHDPGGMRYSPLTQINRENVAKLKIAWIFHTGDISDGKGQRKRSGFETTPLVVDGTLYLTTPISPRPSIARLLSIQKSASNAAPTTRKSISAAITATDSSTAAS